MSCRLHGFTFHGRSGGCHGTFHPNGELQMMTMAEGGGRGESTGLRVERDLFVPLGASASILHVLELARKVAATDAPVLLTGESGTGKKMVAHLIHRESRRRDHPLIAVNCALLPSALAESEIFGDDEAAREDSGAAAGSAAGSGEAGRSRDPGLLARARGGTLLLDDVDHLPPLVQVRILRVIEKRIDPRPALPARRPETGGNLRFISTLAGPPEEAVAAGRLRRDLFYRLAVFPIHIPPLRERQDDIPILAREFLDHFWRLNRRGAGVPPALSDAALRALRRRPWTGNVRELQHVMERAAVVLEPGREVRPDDLSGSESLPPPRGPEVRRELRGPDAEEEPARSREVTGTFAEALLDRPFSDAKSRMTEAFEQEYLTRLIRREGGNMKAAAERGGVNKTTLYRLLQKYNLTKEEVLKGD